MCLELDDYILITSFSLSHIVQLAICCNYSYLYIKVWVQILTSIKMNNLLMKNYILGMPYNQY